MAPQDSNPDQGRNAAISTPTEPLWTVEEVAHYVRLQPETVRMMARARKIPGIKVGKVWRFRPNDIREMLRLPKRHV